MELVASLTVKLFTRKRISLFHYEGIMECKNKIITVRPSLMLFRLALFRFNAILSKLWDSSKLHAAWGFPIFEAIYLCFFFPVVLLERIFIVSNISWRYCKYKFIQYDNWYTNKYYDLKFLCWVIIKCEDKATRKRISPETKMQWIKRLDTGQRQSEIWKLQQ